ERPVGTFSHANLSDIFEYLSPDQTVASLDVLGERMRPGGRIAFWNLFVDRRVPQDHPTLNRLEDLSTKLWDRDRSWFYRAFHVAEVGTRTGGAPPAQRPEPASTATGSGSPTADHAGQEPAAVIPIGASQGDRRSRPR